MTPTGVADEYLVSIGSNVIVPVDDPFKKLDVKVLSFGANVSCTRTLAAFPETSKMTIGELTQIFGFIYEYDPPSV